MIAFDHAISLFLSLFEALRTLRDELASESTQMNENQGSSFGSLVDESDYKDFLIAYNNNEKYSLELVAKNGEKLPRDSCELRSLKDESVVVMKTLVSNLVKDVLGKSAKVDELISSLPGMDRNKKQQMEHIKILLSQNKTAEDELKIAYIQAENKRNKVRTILREVTCEALNVGEQK